MPQRTKGVARVTHLAKSIPRPDVASVIVQLDLSDSDLELSGGAASLMEADFYFDERDEPTVHYTQEAEQGHLTVQDVPPRRRRYRDDVTDNRWVIQLNHELPLDLRVGSSSGDCVLDGDDTTLTHLYVATASGDLDIGLSNKQPRLEDVDVVSSSGDIKLEASGDFPVLNKLSFRSSSGDVKLNAGGMFAALEYLDFQHSSGDIRARLNGTFEKPITLNLRNTSGDVYLDLRGSWKSNLKAILRQTSGDITLRFPREVGVSVSIGETSGDVRADGFTRRARNWVNAHFGEVQTTMTIDISSVSGDVVLRLAE